jgi:benzil reductase ((S)-benzoin forming)
MLKTAIITGASTGIGHAVSIELARRDIQVIAIARKEETLNKLRNEYPDQIQIIAADISCDKGRKNIAHSLEQTEINYIVHNAGVVSPLGELKNATESELRQIIETNLIAPMLLTNLLFSQLSKKHCRILNISSCSAYQASPGLGAYCITKAGLNMWAEILKLEFQKYGIEITTVVPGEVDTPIQKILREISPEIFPLATEFQKAAEHKTLIPGHLCALFLAWLLLHTTRDEYSHREWNIYDEIHHSHWLREKLPLPLNKLKAEANE